MLKTPDQAVFVLTTTTTTTDGQNDYFTPCCACARGVTIINGEEGRERENVCECERERVREGDCASYSMYVYMYIHIVKRVTLHKHPT